MANAQPNITAEQPELFEKVEEKTKVKKGPKGKEYEFVITTRYTKSKEETKPKAKSK